MTPPARSNDTMSSYACCASSVRNTFTGGLYYGVLQCRSNGTLFNGPRRSSTNVSTRMQIGKHSRKLVQLRKAIRQGTLTPDGLLPIEGPILLEEARRSRIDVADVFVRNGTDVATIAQNQVHEVPT